MVALDGFICLSRLLARTIVVPVDAGIVGGREGIAGIALAFLVFVVTFLLIFLTLG
jgi:hypothetical protein